MEKLGWEEELLGLGQLMRGCFNFVFFLPTFTLGDQRTLGPTGTPEWFHLPVPTRASCKVQAFGVRYGPGWSDPVGGWHPVIVQCGPSLVLHTQLSASQWLVSCGPCT